MRNHIDEFITLHVGDVCVPNLQRDAGKPYWPYSKRMTILRVGRELFVPMDIMVEAGADRAEPYWPETKTMKWAARKYFTLNHAEIAAAREHNAYPRRSDRERRVQARREEVCRLLADLLEDVRNA